MVDGWKGDDWFHNGAFREQGMPYIYEQEATRKNEAKWWTGYYDDYDMFMQAGSAGELGREHGLEQVGFWRKIHRASQLRCVLARSGDGQNSGNPAAESAGNAGATACGIRKTSTAPSQFTRRSSRKTRIMTKCFWSWARGITARKSWTAARSARSNSTATPHSISAKRFLRPFLDQYLKDGAPKADVAPVSAFETGTNTWERLPAWPEGCASGCTTRPTPLYLTAGPKVKFHRARMRVTRLTMNTYPIPAKPVPFRARPIDDASWSRLAGRRSARDVGTHGCRRIYLRSVDERR